MLDPKVKVLQLLERYGSVAAVAAVTSYTPSAVSYQLRQLSEQLEVKLIEPAGRGIKLTAAARIVLRHAEVMQTQYELLRSELAATSEEFSGQFTMCGFSTAATHLLPHATLTLRDRHPRLRVRLIEAEPSNCFRLVEGEEADLALVMVTADSPPLSDGRFDQQLLLDDPLDLVVPAGHHLAGRQTVTLADAALESWSIGTPGSAYHQLTVAACVAAGFTPNMAYQADEWETGAALVAQGLCVMLMPRLGSIDQRWPVERIQLSGEPAPARRIMAVTRKGAAGHPLVAEALGLIHASSSSLFTSGPKPTSLIFPTIE
ncbi:LysR substrate-binding domain-containing protein [Paenarthrobacter sp. A20]|uniref:LysR substrate-binding domain-containing protein n=1 Tax=Paenarthrobacter sp. A20 TaxID=2817891 RepID=UPI00209CE2EF|nr:LysR substrate-binding domain-containing protein [Paenarthrobacter sp. A20]MCP1415553.1 DNA-binding transcriptional LysR family regulator [Paenarthrobacter sp. A20]